MLKSLFISVYVTLLFVAAVHTLIELWTSGPSAIWIGSALAVWPSLGFFIKLFVNPVPRTSERLKVMLYSALAGSVLSVLTFAPNPGDVTALAYAILVGLGGSLLYVFWYSKLDRSADTTLVAGGTLPNFVLEDVRGDSISSNSFVGSPTVLLFYRGNWCPLCMAQIKEIAEQYKALSSRGVKVVLISPQPHSHTASLADKFQVPFLFLVDKQNRAAAQLGIIAEHGTPKGLEVFGYDSDTVLPTVVLTDASGKVIFTDTTDNYRVRPEPDTFMRVFEEHGIKAT